MKILKEVGVFVLFLICGWGVCYAIEQFGGLSDPVKTLYIWTGWLSLGCLFVGFFARKWGRFLGHCALAFAFLHIGIFLDFDFYFEWQLMLEEFQKAYILYGVGAFVGMLVLGYFSFCGKFYRPLFYVVIICFLLAVAHFVLIQKVVSLTYSVLMVIGLLGIGYKLYVRFLKNFSRVTKEKR